MDPSTLLFIASLAATAASGLGGSDSKTGSTYTKKQRTTIDEILDSIKGMKGGALDINQNPNFQIGQDYLTGLFSDPDFFRTFEAPLMRQFQEQTVPELANRFASMGSGGALGSTGFRNQLAREGSNLHTNIAALRGSMQQQAIPQLLQYAQQPFSNLMALYQQALQPTQNVYQPPSPGPLAPAAGALASSVAQGYGQNLGNQMANGMPNRFPGQSPITT